MGWCLLSCQFPLIRHSWLGYTGAKLLSCLRRYHKPSRSSKEPPDSFLGSSTQGLCMIHGVASQSVKFTPSGEAARCFQLNLNHILTQWTLCFVGFPHSQWIKTVMIISNHGHWNCNNQDPLQDPPVVISLQPFTLFSILSLFLFLVYCCSSFLSKHKGPHSYP